MNNVSLMKMTNVAFSEKAETVLKRFEKIGWKEVGGFTKQIIIIGKNNARCLFDIVKGKKVGKIFTHPPTR